MIDKKHMIVIDFVLIVGTLLLIAGSVGYARPLIIAPVDGLVTTETAVLFSFEKADLILIDDNPAFTSPTEIYVKDNLIINLKPGVYYWKVVGISESMVRELIIESEVDLKLKESENGEEYEVVNSGNTRLNVDVYNGGVLSGNVVLDVDESEEVSGTKFIGREDE